MDFYGYSGEWQRAILEYSGFHVPTERRNRMKAYLISDNIDSFVGLKIAGIKGSVVHTPEEALEEILKAKGDMDIGIIILTEKIAELIPNKVKELKLSRSLPLVVEIPDRHGSTKGESSITKYVRESIGLKI